MKLKKSRTTLIQKIKNDQKGISSILVVFMMIILVTFGAIAITSAYANIKLANKTLAWNKEYYNIDSDGEIALAYIDQILLLRQSDIGTEESLQDNLQNYDQYLSGLKVANMENGTEINLNFSSQENKKSFAKHLAISLLVNSNETPRYNILKWQEWQDPFEYKALGEQDYWDGDVDSLNFD